MPRTLAIQMEKIDSSQLTDGYSSLLMLKEALKRGYQVYQFEDTSLSIVSGEVSCIAKKLKEFVVPLEKEEKKAEVHPIAEMGPAEQLSLAEVDVVLMRQNPPFNMRYITASYFLEMAALKHGVLVANNPAAVRNNIEKLIPLHFEKRMPDTLISKEASVIRKFFKKHKEVVLKPLYGFGGFGVYKYSTDDPNIEAHLEGLSAQGAEPIIVQAFIPEASSVNIRVVYFDGDIAAVMNVVPPEGEHRVYRESVNKEIVLNPKQKEIAEEVGAFLKEKDILFAGADIIGEKLLEVNVTSVGSLGKLNGVYPNRCFEAEFLDALERKLA